MLAKYPFAVFVGGLVLLVAGTFGFSAIAGWRADVAALEQRLNEQEYAVDELRRTVDSVRRSRPTRDEVREIADEEGSYEVDEHEDEYHRARRRGW